MGVAKGFDQDRARVSAHRAGASRCVARALDDLAPAIRRRRRPRKRQSLRAVVSLSNLRQSDLDRCAADRDAINPVANVGLRGGMVCGQLADGFRDERFEVRGWHHPAAFHPTLKTKMPAMIVKVSGSTEPSYSVTWLAPDGKPNPPHVDCEHIVPLSE